MNKQFIHTSVITIAMVLFALSLPSPTNAETENIPQSAGSAFDLINAVNALRTSNGLPAYSINSILMYTAQNQADFMAANGIVTHSGPGGISLTDRLLAAGYPLAGDLSLGGFRAENIMSGGEDMPAESAVDQWTSDAPHLDTMLSPKLTEVGAGVAIAGGRVYYVIDAAHPTTSGISQAAATVFAGGSVVPFDEATVSVVAITTPNANGDVIHEVILGQTLWQIAISYNVKIDDIKQLNNLHNDNIYPGQKLLVKKEGFIITATPTEVPTLRVTVLPTITESPMPTTIKIETSSTPAPMPDTGESKGTIMGIVIGIIVLALLGSGLFTWLGIAKKT